LTSSISSSLAVEAAAKTQTVTVEVVAQVATDHPSPEKTAVEELQPKP
jgi:hypothetical protein